LKFKHKTYTFILLNNLALKIKQKKKKKFPQYIIYVHLYFDIAKNWK